MSTLRGYSVYIEPFEQMQKEVGEVNNGEEVKDFTWEKACDRARYGKECLDAFFQHNGKDLFCLIFDRGVVQCDRLISDLRDRGLPDTQPELEDVDKSLRRLCDSVGEALKNLDKGQKEAILPEKKVNRSGQKEISSLLSHRSPKKVKAMARG